MATTPASSLQVTLRRLYRKSRAEAFKAWTDPKELKRWWGPPGYDAPSIEVDLRVGGRYRFAMRKLPDGKTTSSQASIRKSFPASGWSSPGTGKRVRRSAATRW